MRARDALGIGFKLISVMLLLEGLYSLSVALPMWQALRSAPDFVIGSDPWIFLAKTVVSVLAGAALWWASGNILQGKGPKSLNLSLTKRGMGMGLLLIIGCGCALPRLWAPLIILRGKPSCGGTDFFALPDAQVNLLQLLAGVLLAAGALTGWRGGLDHCS